MKIILAAAALVFAAPAFAQAAPAAGQHQGHGSHQEHKPDAPKAGCDMPCCKGMKPSEKMDCCEKMKAQKPAKPKADGHTAHH